MVAKLTIGVIRLGRSVGAGDVGVKVWAEAAQRLENAPKLSLDAPDSL